VHDELVHTRSERPQDVLVGLQPLISAYSGRDLKHLIYQTFRRIEIQLFRILRPLQGNWEAVLLRNSAVHLDERWRAQQSAHVRIEMRDGNSQAVGAVDLSMQLRLHFRWLGLLCDLSLQ